MKKIIKKFVPKKIINLGLKIMNFINKIVTLIIIKIYKLKYKNLIIRKGTTDSAVFRSIFLFKEFKLPIKITPKLIIDAGAYTGLSALYYSSKYPSAKIICIEPENSNFEILENNTKNLPNITRIKAALYYKNAFLKIKDTGTGKWGFVVKEVFESENFDIKAITIEEILKKSGYDKIDILKLDIEGSEKQLFSKNYQTWLEKVNIIVLELHDRIVDGCTKSLYSAINKNEWKEFKKNEKVILIKKDYYKSHFNQV